jgi:ZIP family zinc transporter
VKGAAIDTLTQAVLVAFAAGLTIPLAAFAALEARLHPGWLTDEARHAILAFGGGVLISAIALVLVPEGMELTSAPGALAAFAAGGISFALVERWLANRGGEAGDFLAMLLHYLPEALALGAVWAADREAGTLFALMIALQNLPEAFNAFRELDKRAEGRRRVRLMAMFCILPFAGALAALGGYAVLQELPRLLGALLLFSAGGILYLTFQDIAPSAHLKRSWAPPLGAVGGFMLGMVAWMVIHAEA